MKEIREKVDMIVASQTRMEQKIEKIDTRGETHTLQLGQIGDIKDDTKRIADAIEKATNRQFWISAFGLALLAGISYMLISAVFQSNLRIGDGIRMIEMGVRPPEGKQ